MPTKIRLQRHGKKRYAYYHVVVADARAPRDGKFIEKLGTYNPNDNPATIDISFDRSLHWVKEGAQPTDTVRALLSYKGVMHKDHLDRGVTKGALTQEQADKKFEAWMKEKEAKVDGKKEVNFLHFNAIFFIKNNRYCFCNCFKKSMFLTVLSKR